MYKAPIRNSKLFEDQNNEMQKAFQAGYRKSLKEQYIPGPEVYDQWPPRHKGILPDSSDDGTPPFPKFPYGQQRSAMPRGSHLPVPLPDPSKNPLDSIGKVVETVINVILLTIWNIFAPKGDDDDSGTSDGTG
jgi:hypothetical protein